MAKRQYKKRKQAPPPVDTLNPLTLCDILVRTNPEDAKSVSILRHFENIPSPDGPFPDQGIEMVPLTENDRSDLIEIIKEYPEISDDSWVFINRHFKDCYPKATQDEEGNNIVMMFYKTLLARIYWELYQDFLAGKQLEIVNCAVCGKTFIRRRQNQKYCTRTCLDRQAQRKHKIKKRARPLT